MSDLSQRLRHLRIESGMSQSDVGKQVGLSRSAVTQIELGNREISTDELVRFATVFRHSPATLLAEPGKTADEGAMLDEILAAMGDLAEPTALRASLERLLQISKLLTQIERDLGVDVYGPEAFAFLGAPPRTTWEATHQGYAVAGEERRRLDLGSTPIRDLPETLAMLRVRASRLPLSDSTFGLFLHTDETGPIVIVNEAASVEKRRFQFAHGLAHMLFDRQRRWIVCDQDERAHHHEVRANAFASRFLMPASGVKRYLRSIGRDTMAQSYGSELEVLSDSASVPSDKSRVRVSARSRRGNWEFNAYELSQVASYFGVSTSLVAHGLRNLRHLSDDELDRLTSIEGEQKNSQARLAMRLPKIEQEPEYDPFVSRLLGLATKGWRRDALSAERIELIAGLLNLNEEERAQLFGTAGSETAEGPAARSDKGGKVSDEK